MPARIRNLIIRRGDSLQRQFNLIPGPEGDIASFTATLTIYNDDGSVMHSATSSNSELVPHNGYLTLDVSAATTTGMTLTGLSRRGNVFEPAPCGELPFSASGLLANYILRVTSPDSVTKTLLKGSVCFDGE